MHTHSTITISIYQHSLCLGHEHIVETNCLSLTYKHASHHQH